MNIARILYPVEVLGPGKRIGIWVCGCRRGCKGCSNPELWEPKPEYELTVGEVMRLINNIAESHTVDGITISGGEPMDQADEIAEIVRLVKKVSSDILIYSGYQIEELRTRKNPEIDSILHEAAVLIDGAYIEELNDNSVLRGSSNQRIHILNPEYTDFYQRYFAVAHNQIQNFITIGGVISVGIHHQSF